MSTRRDQIAMTDDERRAFLDEQLFAVIGTVGPKGWPHLVTLGFSRDNDRLLVTSYAASQKVRNLERDPTITVLVEVSSPYSEVRGVMAYGRATVINDPEHTAVVATEVLERARTRGETQEIPQERVAPKRRLIAIDIERWITWDHRKLQGAY